jgi:hypothetical protein
MHRDSRLSARLFLQSSETGPQTPPFPKRVCPLPPFGSGGAHSLAGEGVGYPNFDEGTDTLVLYLYMYFVG